MRVLTFMLFFFFISGLFVSVFNPVLAKSVVSDSWHTKAPMCYSRDNLGVVAVDGKIYAIGGVRGSNDFTNINERYDPVTDKWVTLEPMPTSRANFAIAAYESKIYCIGGGIHSSDPPLFYEGLSVNEVYDVATDSWSTKTSFPMLLMNMQAHAVDGKIFVITLDGKLYMYNPITDEWIIKTNMPSPIDVIVVSAVINDKIVVVHLIGTHEGMESRVKIYDPKTDVWSEGSVPAFSVFNIENNGHAFAMGLDGGAGVTTGLYAPQRFYVLGAIFNANYANSSWSNQVYNPADNTWTFAKDMPTYRRSFGVAVVDDILYVIGGDTNKNEQYIPIGYHGTLSSVTSLPVASNSSEREPSGYFLRNSIIIALVLICGIAIAVVLFFKKGYEHGSKV